MACFIRTDVAFRDRIMQEFLNRLSRRPPSGGVRTDLATEPTGRGCSPARVRPSLQCPTY
jgi:predicted RNA-binding protein YlxR (DUF448 family)